MRKIVPILLLLILFTRGAMAMETRGFLTQEEIALFFEQGYLLKSECFSADEMATLHEEIATAIDRALAYVQQAETVLSDAEQILYLNGSRIVFKRSSEQSASIARINGCAGIEPRLREVVRSDKMVYTFFELLGTSELEHLISQIHPKLPGDGILYPRHRDIQFRKSFDPDWQDVLGNGSYAICIIPIDPMTRDNGGLWIEQPGREERIWIEAQPGDLLFMHPYLYHGSEPNLSSSSRRTLLTGFCAFGANHKPYPGADVNVRLTLREGGRIEATAAPWKETPFAGPTGGH